MTNWEINDKVGQSKYCASSPVQGRDTKGENPNFWNTFIIQNIVELNYLGTWVNFHHQPVLYWFILLLKYMWSNPDASIWKLIVSRFTCWAKAHTPPIFNYQLSLTSYCKNVSKQIMKLHIHHQNIIYISFSHTHTHKSEIGQYHAWWCLGS